MLKCLVMLFFVLIPALTGVSGQGFENLSFRHLDIDNGLSHNLVHDICQDHSGYLWIATQDGLNRYDGYNTQVFRNEPGDSASLPSNTVHTVFVDHRNDLWIGAMEGCLARYERDHGTFTRFPSSLTGIRSEQILCIQEDRQHRLWIGTQNGLYRYDRATRHAQLVPYDEEVLRKDASSSGAIFHIQGDDKGFLWLSTYHGLNRYDPRTGSFRHYFPEDPSGEFTPGNWIKHTFSGWDGRIWICTASGFKLFDPRSETFEDGFRALGIQRPEDELRLNTIVADQEKNLWFCGWQQSFFYPSDGSPVVKLRHTDQEPSSLSGTSLTDAFVDDFGGVWLGTWNAGVNYYNRSFRKFGLIRKSDRSQTLSGNIVRAITTDRSGNLWLGIDQGGINVLDRTSGAFRYLRHEPGNPNSLIYDNVRHLMWEGESRLWIGTQQGLDLYDSRYNTFRHFTASPDRPGTLVSNDIRYLAHDMFGRLWIGTYGGISVRDPENGIMAHFTHKPGDSTSLSDNRIYAIYEDGEKVMWVGTRNGLNRFRRTEGTFTRYHSVSSELSALSNDWITCLFEDSRGILWIGTYGGGLNRYHREDDRFSHITTRDGLPNNVIYGILEDESGYLWLSTNRGLSRFRLSDTSFVNYRREDGLQSNQFFFNACYQSGDGEMFFGGVNGLNHFYPSDIEKDRHPPNVLITSFRLFNKEVPVAEPGEEDAILTRHVSRTDTVILRHDQSVFSFEFTAIHYAHPWKNRYAYKLEGLEERWNKVGQTRVASYSNLDPGDYLFRVKAANSDRVWNKEGARIFIRVLPPWWETAWFRIALGLTIVLIIYLLFLLISNREKLKANLRMERMHAAQAREMDRMKQRFYSNISHEFRTPLTLILGPVERLLERKNLTREEQMQYRVIRKNASRLLRLVNQLLDLTRIEAGYMKLSVTRSDVMEYTRAVLNSFDYRAEKKQIHYQKEIESGQNMAWFDADKLEKILYNLLSNAFKFTPEGGTVTVHATIQQDDPSRRLVISVRDSGRGIPASGLSHIFDRFVRLGNDTSGSDPGTGIGLTLAHQLALIHKGNLTAESREGEGSVFTVELPVSRERFKEEETGKHGEEESPAGDILPDDEQINSLPLPDQGGAERCVMLFIDDNEEIREFIRDQLQADFHVILAGSGEEGYELALEEKPDVIISDVMMPGMDGIELCRRIKAHSDTGHIPFLMVTALHSRNEKISGLKAGADDYIVKPFSMKEFELKIQNLVQTSRRIRELFRRTISLKPADILITPPDEVFLRNAIKAVERRMGDPDFGIEALCRETGTSRMQLYRKIRALTGQTVKEFMRNLRLERAAQLLRKKMLTVNEVAYMVGFREISYFRKCFKSRFFQTPSEYARQSGYGESDS